MRAYANGQQNIIERLSTLDKKKNIQKQED